MDFGALLTKAHAAAKEAAASVEDQPMAFDCGFAWVRIDGRSPLAAYCRKMIRQAGARLEGRDKQIAEQNARMEHGGPGHPTGWEWWRPGGDHRQSISIHEEGARAFIRVLADAGYSAELGSRLD